MPGIGGEEDDGGSARKRKRKSRWATEEDDKTFIPGMPTVLPAGLEKDQEELYLRMYLKTFNFLFQYA